MKTCTKCGETKARSEFYQMRVERKDHCKECRKASSKARYHNDVGPEKARDIRYGFAPGQYDEMAAAQDGLCAVCGQQPVGPFHVDHDHSCCPAKARSCGKCVRRLLCSNCNRGLGCFGDDPDRMLAAALYVLEFRHEVLPEAA